MKNLISIIIPSLAALFVANSARAACSTTACSGLVERINVRASAPSQIFISTDGDETSLSPTCTPSNGSEIILDPAGPTGGELYRMLLAAHLASREVYIRVVPNSSGYCEVGYAYIGQ